MFVASRCVCTLYTPAISVHELAELSLLGVCVHCTHLQSLFTSLPNCRFSVVCTLYTPVQLAELSLCNLCSRAIVASRWCVHCTHLQSLFTSLPNCRFSVCVYTVHTCNLCSRACRIVASRWCVHCTHLQSLFTSLPNCRFSVCVYTVHTCNLCSRACRIVASRWGAREAQRRPSDFILRTFGVIGEQRILIAPINHKLE
jgi:uncharacterized protein affecting Mg2+/Co2+ transport